MTVSTLSSEELVKIRAKLKPVIDKFGADAGAGLVKQLQDALDRQRAKK